MENIFAINHERAVRRQAAFQGARTSLHWEQGAREEPGVAKGVGNQPDPQRYSS